MRLVWRAWHGLLLQRSAAPSRCACTLQRAWRWARARRALRGGSLRQWALLAGAGERVRMRRAAQRVQRWVRALRCAQRARYQRWRLLVRRAWGAAVPLQRAWRGYVAWRAVQRLRNPDALRFKTLVVVQLAGGEREARLRACLACWLAGGAASVCACSSQARALQCSICLQESEGVGGDEAGAAAAAVTCAAALAAAQHWKVLKCGHALHTECLVQWVDSQARGFAVLQAASTVVGCPLCKRAATRVVRWAWKQEDNAEESRVLWAPPPQGMQ